MSKVPKNSLSITSRLLYNASRAVHQAAEADFSRRKQACGFFHRLSADPLESKGNIRLTIDTVMV